MSGIDGYDWSPLGGSNPVPGDPDAVRAMAERFSELSSTVGLQNRLLRGVSGETSSVWKGPAAEAFQAKVGPLPGELDKLTSSYDKASEALQGYWPKLREAQNQALAALAKARAAHQAIGASQAQLNAQNEQVSATAATYNRVVNQPPAHQGAKLTPAAAQARQAAQQQAQANYQAAQAQAAATQARLGQAQQSLSDAQSQAAQATSMAKAAASACASSLHGASKAGIQNPHHSIFDSVVGGFVNALDGKDLADGYHWATHHVGDIEFAASLALGPAGLLLTSKGRHLVHEGLEDVHEGLKAIEPGLEFVSKGLGVVTGVLGVASLVLAPFGVGEVLDGANEILMGAKTLDDGLLLAAGDNEAKGELVADGIGLATLGASGAIEAGTETLKAGSELAEASENAEKAEAGVSSATEALTNAGKVVGKAEANVAKASEDVGSASRLADRADAVLDHASARLEPKAQYLSDVMHSRLDEATSAQGDAEKELADARTSQSGAQKALDDAQAKQAEADKNLNEVTKAHDQAVKNFDLGERTSWAKNLAGGTTLKKAEAFAKEPTESLRLFRASNNIDKEAGPLKQFTQYYASQFSGPKSVVALRAAKTAYLTYDSSGFLSKTFHGPKVALPDLAASAVNGGGAGG